MHIKTSNQEKLVLGIGDYTCNWGVHICGLYSSEKERDEIIFGYIGEGLRAGDLQLYCPVERTIEDFFYDFSTACPSCQEKMHEPNHLSISTARELYYPDGIFDPWHMDDALGDFFKQSQKKGKRNVRATAEMAWALEAIPGVEHLMAYEARLNYFVVGKPWISICMYNLNKFSGATIMNVLRTQPYTINGGVITQNPYYVHPDKWLAENAPQFLNPQK
ncbi:MAG TPA: MEDS domain-containing protein [Prolixibacteraceae bacterium]|nr:MEDS domain-containing protein [Prolixibacteraceae bacterium]